MDRRLTRNTLLTMAQALQQDPQRLWSTLQSCPDEVAQRAVITTWHWGKWGCQSVELPHTYAAALMATDAKGAIDDEHLPWPCFEIQIPTDLLYSSHGEIFSVMITEKPQGIEFRGQIATASYFLTYHDTASSGTSTYRSLADLAVDAKLTAKGVYISDELSALFDEDLETRVWAMLTRLVAGVIILINTARVDKPELYSLKPPRMKRGELRLNTHKLGAPLELDLRQAISDFVTGTRRNEPKSSWPVRGHYRMQPHGQNRVLRRKQWIQPFRKGKGPLQTRPIRIHPPDSEE